MLRRLPFTRAAPPPARSYVFDGKPPTLKSGELAKRCAPPPSPSPQALQLRTLSAARPLLRPGPCPADPCALPIRRVRAARSAARQPSRPSPRPRRRAPLPTPLTPHSPRPVPTRAASAHAQKPLKTRPAAPQAGNAEEAEKFAKRDLRVTREHNEECKRLLRLMGAGCRLCAARTLRCFCLRKLLPARSASLALDIREDLAFVPRLLP